MTAGLLAVLVVALGGSDPARLKAWAGTAAGTRVELARALSEADLPRLATGALSEALLLDREQPDQLAAALAMFPLSLTGDPPVPRVLGALAETPADALGVAEQSLHAFLVGQSLLAAGQPQAALSHLLRVAPGSPAYAPARYLAGVARITPPLEDLKAAGAHFREAIVEAETGEQAPVPVVQTARRLALLGLARLFYEAGDFEVALYYYRRLPPAAPERVQVAFESAWAHVLRGDMHRALGEVHGARAPAVRHPGRPELNLVAGAALMGLCQYERGRAELEQLERDYLAHLPRLASAAEALRRIADPEQARRLIEPDSGLHPRVRYLLLEQPAVRHALAEERALAAERARARGLIAAPALDRLGEALAAQQGRRVGAAIRAALETMVEDWTRLRAAHGELMIDLLEAQSTQLTSEIESGQVDRGPPPEARIPVMGQDWQRWQFEGHWWPDELGYYRSTLPSLCVAAGEDDG